MKILSREYKTEMGRLNWCNLPGENADPSQALKNRYILRFTWQQLTNPLVHHPPPPPPPVLGKLSVGLRKKDSVPDSVPSYGYIGSLTLSRRPLAQAARSRGAVGEQ